MKAEYRLCEVEDALKEMSMTDVDDDIVETEDNELWVSGWYMDIPDLALHLHEGVVCVWDEEAEIFMPDYRVTVFYEIEIGTKDWICYGRGGFLSALDNWLQGQTEKRQMSMEQLEQLRCRIVIPGKKEDEDL